MLNAKSSGERVVTAESIQGFDAYSEDNQFVGRVMGPIAAAAVNAEAMEEIHVDPIGPDGRVHGPRRMLINGTGTVLQSTIIVEQDSLEADLAGRRVVLPLTLVQLEALPKHSSVRHENES